MTQRAFNFSAGPAVLPEPVLARVGQEMMSLPGAKASVLEISHRSKQFRAILESAEQNIRTLLQVPDGYRVLFLQGGSRLQFAMIPMNLLTPECPSADYVVTGSWGKNALAEARKQGEMQVTWDGGDTNYDRLPQPSALKVSPGAAYVHFTSNETIQGVQFVDEPATSQGGPLVCDASSDFLSRPLPMDRYGLLYACAQKNAGPAGVTIVLLREDLLERSGPSLPGYLSFKVHAEAGSLMNTAPTFAIYVVDLVTQWLLDEVGGLKKMHQINQAKSAMLYEVIDESNGFYQGHAREDCRSLMNVTFRLPSEDDTATFLAEAEERNLTALAGHRSVGGIRASIYNAMHVAGVEALRDLMLDFKKRR